MLVIDHGGGYMSLYGHNEELFRKVGEVRGRRRRDRLGRRFGRPQPARAVLRGASRQDAGRSADLAHPESRLCVTVCPVCFPDHSIPDQLPAHGTGRDSMASTAPIFVDAPAPLGGTSLDPYGQLLKMLLPRAHAIVVYDPLGVAVWASERRRRPGTAGPAAARPGRRAARAPARSARASPSRCPASRSLLLRAARRRGRDDRRRRHGEPRVEPRAAALHAGAGAAASRAAVPRARTRLAVQHRRPAAQPRRARPRPRTAARRGAGRSRRRQLAPTTSPSWCRAASTTSAARSARC